MNRARKAATGFLFAAFALALSAQAQEAPDALVKRVTTRASAK